MFAKLREEVEEKFGVGEDARVEEISFESLKLCEYLKAVLNECLRLYPSVPQNFRVATKNTTLPRGGGSDGMSPILVRKVKLLCTVFTLPTETLRFTVRMLTNSDQRWFEPETRNWVGRLFHSTVVQESVWVNNSP